MTPDRTRPPAYSQTFEIDIKEAETTYFGQTPVHVIKAGDQDVVKLEVLFPGSGSRLDQKKGESYLTWKLLAQGTTTRSAEDIAGLFDQFGGFTENFPSLDTPSFTLYCLNRHLDNLLPVLADVVRDAAFPQDEFQLNQDIIREQLRIQNNKNNILASKLFREHLFGEDHPYGKVMKEEDLDALNQEDVQKFYSGHGKQPEILVSGKLSDDQIRKIGEHFYTSEERSNSGFEAGTASGSPADFYLEKDKSLQSSLRIGLQTIPKNHPDYLPLRIATHALGGYFGSRLMKNIREDKGYTYGIYSSLVSLEKTSYFIIGSDVQKEFRENAVEEIHKEIMQLSDHPLDVVELQMVKNHLLGSFQSSISSPFALADKFKGVHYYGLDYSYYQHFMQKIQEITAEEISEVMQKYLHPDNMLHVIVG